MRQASMNTPYSKKLEDKFSEAQAYLKANGFSRSITTLFQDIERCSKN